VRYNELEGTGSNAITPVCGFMYVWVCICRVTFNHRVGHGPITRRDIWYMAIRSTESKCCIRGTDF
jgi:hypothetical protein